MSEYNLNFRGYWIDAHSSAIPSVSGVYLVYRCTYDAEGVTLKELLYIGQSTDLNARINDHEKKEIFLHECEEGETIYYSVAEVPQNDLDVVENALIFAQKQRLNTQLKDHFEHDIPVSLKLEGRCKLLNYVNFTIDRA